MAPELTTKVRLVRCPKCRNLLPESPRFQVYKCGGCGAILQSKNRTNGMRSRSASLNETVAAQKIGLDHVSEGKKPSSSPKASLPELGECSSDQNNERGRNRSLEANECSSSSDKPTFPGSGEHFSDQNNEKNEEKSSEDQSSSSSHSATLPDSGEFSSDQNKERDQSKSSEGNDVTSSSNPEADSGECFSNQKNDKSEDKSSEDKESRSSSHNASLQDSVECTSDQNNDRNQSTSSEGNESSSKSPQANFPDSGECFSDQKNDKSEDKSSEDKESRSSSHNASLQDSGESTSDHNNERDQSKSSEGNESSSTSPHATFPDSREFFSDQKNEGDQCKSSEGNESSSSIPKATFPDSGECFPDQKIEREQSQSEGNESSRSSLQANFPDLGECFSDKNKEMIEDKSFEDNGFGSSSHKAILPDSRGCTQTNPRDPDMSSEDCNGEQLEDLNFPNEDQDNQSDQTDSHDFDREKLEVSNEICSSTEFVHNESKEPLPLTRAFSEVSRNDESSPLAETNVEVDINKEINSDFRSSSTVNPGATRGSSSIATAHFPARESISLDSLVSFPDEQLEEPQISIQNGFNHVRSSDTFEHTEFFPSSEINSAPRYTSKSPENRSHHAYDGSVSSFDGMDDQFSNRNMHLNFVHSEERARRDKFLVGRMMNRDSELQHQARDSWSSLSGKSDHAMKYRKGGQDELLQPRRQGHPSRDWNRLKSEEYMPRMAFRRRVSQGGYENGGQANQMRNNYPRNSGYQSLEKSANSEQDNMTLLRMVCALQDQVNNLNGGRVSGGATWKERHIPQYNNYEASEEELFQDPNYGRYLRGHRAGSHYPPQHHKFTGIPFSSEATTSRHQVDPSYLHRGSREWQCSAPLPQPLRCTNNGLCRLHPGHNCWTSYDKSYASSPERYVEPDFPHWGRETVSDDLRRHEVKKHFRERHHLAKRHFRPIAGGAPIITCYNCLKPLQIPADFLLFKRRCHKLRCGACSEVLKFSLQKRSHIIPYEQNAMAPPPSEVGDYSAAVNGGFLASTSQDADPVSCSDDYGYGLSYCRSCSTEGDPGTLAPSNSLRGNSDGRDTPYRSLDPMKDGKELVLKQSRNKDKDPVKTYVSARPSLSSEIEEQPQRSSSPLHRLMGYSSPSQVIRGSRSTRTGTSSYSTER